MAMVDKAGACGSDSGEVTGVKSFRLTHLVFGHQQTAHEGAMPAWLMHPEYRWFLDAHVLPLKVGAHIDTEFWRVVRVA